ncbi:hypothetical protein [Brucella lupini]
MTEIAFFGVRDISFIDVDGVYVGKVMFQTDDDRLDEGQRGVSHDIDLVIRINGDPNLPYSEVRELFIREAEQLLAISHKHLSGKDWPKLHAMNVEASEKEE